MKNYLILFAFILSSHSFAKSADYVCTAGSYRVDVFLTGDKSTSVVLTDRMGLIFQSYAKVVEVKDEKTFFYFYPGLADPARVIFWTADVLELPAKISGRIDSKARGFLLNEKMDCTRI